MSREGETKEGDGDDDDDKFLGTRGSENITKIESRYHRHRLLALDRKHQVIGLGDLLNPNLNLRDPLSSSFEMSK